MAALRRIPPLAAALLVALSVVCGAAFATAVYPDRAGDVRGAPDVTRVRLSNTASTITFRIRFATAPPLRFDSRQGWVDMLLIGIDVPPLGPPPTVPGGEWPGVNFALGTHGPSRVGQLGRRGKMRSTPVARFEIDVSGRTLGFSIARRALGNPEWFAFSLATAREGSGQSPGGVDVVPQRGTYRYRLSASGR
jgi:hypothetical protein